MAKDNATVNGSYKSPKLPESPELDEPDSYIHQHSNCPFNVYSSRSTNRCGKGHCGSKGSWRVG